jgi:ZIP family zinc transporter
MCITIREGFSAAELSAHSFIDGLAIGIGFQLEFHVGLIVAFAVIAHDFSDGLNTVTVMLRSGNSLRSSIKMLLLDAITPMLGVLSTLVIRIPENYLKLFLPFFAGGFLYLGSSDLLSQAHEKNEPLVSIAFTLLGFLLIFVITRLLEVQNRKNRGGISYKWFCFKVLGFPISRKFVSNLLYPSISVPNRFPLPGRAYRYQFPS